MVASSNLVVPTVYQGVVNLVVHDSFLFLGRLGSVVYLRGTTIFRPWKIESAVNYFCVHTIMEDRLKIDL